MVRFRPSAARLMSLGALFALVFALFAVALPTGALAACAAGAAPSVTTDQGDYQPGDTVHISGAGFACAAALTVTITPPSGIVTRIPVTTDATTGALTATYQIPGPDGDPSGLYTLVVTDANGQTLASMTFVDTHFRYGSLSWVESATTPGLVTFTLDTAWRWDFPWRSGAYPALGSTFFSGYYLQLGDGQYAPVNMKVVSVDAADDWFFSTATITHGYSRAGHYQAIFSNCCRLSTLLQNNHDDAFRVTSDVDLQGVVTQSPHSNLPPIISCPSSGTCAFDVPVVGLAPGATAAYSFSPPTLSGLATPVPSGPSGHASLSLSGQFSWNTTGAQVGLYATQVQIGEETSAAAALPTYTVADFIIQVVNGRLPTFVAPTPVSGTVTTAPAGVAFSLPIDAATANSGATATVSLVDPPTGSTLRCSDPAPTATPHCTFAWTPTQADAGQHILTFTARDSLGLVSGPLSLTVDVVTDTTPPLVTATATPGPGASGWNTGPVRVALSAVDVAGAVPGLVPSGVAGLTYTLDGGPAVTVTGDSAALTVSGDGTHTLTYSATDKAGNQSAPQTQQIRIDGTAPTLSGAPTTAPNGSGWYNGDVTIHWTAADKAGGSGIDPATAPADTVITAEGQGLTAQASVSDLAGNTTQASSVPAVNIDRTAPTAVVQLTPAANGNGWNRGPVAATINATDDLSGVAGLAYTLDGGPAVTVTGDSAALTVSGDGTHTLTYSATDKAGNQFEPQTQVIHIDGTAPTLSGAPTTAANSSGWYNSSVTIHWTAADNPGGSGIDPATAPADTVLTAEGQGLTAQASVSDLAGNTTQASSVPAVNIDRTAPTAVVQLTPAANGNGWNRGPVAATINATDDLSGVAGLTYTLDGGPAVTVTGDSAALTVSGDGTHTLTYSATDKAGNQSEPQTQVIHIDGTAPTLSGAPTTAPNGSGWYNSSVTIHWTAADNQGGSGIDPATVPADTVITAEGQGLTAQASVSDLAGNTTEANSAPAVNIDRTAPTIHVQGVTDGATYVVGKVPTPTYTATDGGSGVATQSATLTAPTTASGAGTYVYTVTATDNAGNTATVSVTYSVHYQFAGFSTTGGTSVNANRTIPLMFTLLDADGNPVTDAVATLEVDGQPATPQAQANSGDTFSVNDGHYQYQLKLRDQGVHSGTVTLAIHLDDGTTQTLTLTVE